MTRSPDIALLDADLDAIAGFEGRVAVFIPESGQLDQMARRVNRLMRGALERFVESEAFSRLREGEARDLAFPSGMAAEAVQVIRLDKRMSGLAARKAGGAIGAALRKEGALLLSGARRDLPEILLGAVLRAYAFTDHRSAPDEGEPREAAGPIRVMVPSADAAEAGLPGLRALADGVYFTRDLVNEPSNVLTTTEFARRLDELTDLGIKVTILDEEDLAKIGMRALLAVGQGSESPSKVVIMGWDDGGTEPPVALVGKGVVFDTGGISLKPAAGMEEMTMDMGGAGVVAGVMKTLALRRAAAKVVGLVGLVENMPDGRAQRPGDVVRTLKGDTVEVINTDAEGRLVLCDLLWYAQEQFAPRAVIDLATLTGAIVTALGNENAGVFCNDEGLAKDLLAAAAAEGEGAWRMPLGASYARLLKSRVADLKNSAGRTAGAITAAEFLNRFIKPDTVWAHIDIAGVATRNADSELAPKGATGWGVLTLNRLIADRYEG